MRYVERSFGMFDIVGSGSAMVDVFKVVVVMRLSYRSRDVDCLRS